MILVCPDGVRASKPCGFLERCPETRHFAQMEVREALPSSSLIQHFARYKAQRGVFFWWQPKTSHSPLTTPPTTTATKRNNTTYLNNLTNSITALLYHSAGFSHHRLCRLPMVLLSGDRAQRRVGWPMLKPRWNKGIAAEDAGNSDGPGGRGRPTWRPGSLQKVSFFRHGELLPSGKLT